MTFDLWAFLGDETFWDWFRPLTAALLGAVIGGSFTIIAQRVQSKADREAQANRDAAEDARQAIQIEAARRAQIRADSMRDVRGLVEIFATVHTHVQEYGGVISVTKNQERHPVWIRWDTEIWPASRSTESDVLSLTITDDVTRDYIRRLLRAMDYAPEYVTSDDIDLTLQFVAAQISSVALEVLGSHLRAEPPTDTALFVLTAMEVHQQLPR